MRRILAKELHSQIGRTVLLTGWLNNTRSFGKLTFLILRDRTGFSQIVIQDPTQIRKVASLQIGSVLKVCGKAEASSQAELGVEVIDPEIEVITSISMAPPLDYYKPEISSDLEFILDHRAIALRNRQIQAVFTIQAEIVHAYRLFMHDEVGAVEYFSPNIIGASSEGGAEFFNVDYFGHNATLAQSSQLYKQIMVGVNERVFALAPFFRAEPSHTTRHLSEGKQLEFEMGFFQSWHEILEIQENALKFILKRLIDHCAHELKILGNPLITAPLDIAFPRFTFREAQEIYFQRTGVDDRQEDDLSPSAEKELCRYALETFGTECVIIVDWLASKRPFYSYLSDTNPELTNTFDLLCAGTEITSGGQRCHTYESMVEGILRKGMDPANFSDYLSVFQYGMPPHGGFGMGLERLTMTLLRLKNIREASLFPSDPKRIACNRIKANIIFGAENLRNEIIHLLKKHEMAYTHIQHEHTTTSEESAKVRGTRIEEGVKALILKGKHSKKHFQFNIPSHLKLDMKAVSELVGEKCEFESPELLKESFGLIVGGVPPFGNLLNIDTYFDETINNLDKVAFNCGLPTESIVMKKSDLVTLVAPIFATFSKN